MRVCARRERGPVQGGVISGSSTEALGNLSASSAEAVPPELPGAYTKLCETPKKLSVALGSSPELVGAVLTSPEQSSPELPGAHRISPELLRALPSYPDQPELSQALWDSLRRSLISPQFS
eukprot:10441507-Alexandrium_andersonii.AAC.1